MVSTPEGEPIPWRKSSYSSDSANCVEAAASLSDIVIRDSKDPAGPTIKFGAGSWSDFIVAVCDGAFDPATQPPSRY
jgi:Domain of unknown function (DUF397)